MYAELVRLHFLKCFLTEDIVRRKQAEFQSRHRIMALQTSAAPYICGCRYFSSGDARAMSRKLTSFAIPLSLLMSSMVARPSLAVTPTKAFGVTAIVQARCNVSAAMFHGTYIAAMRNAASSVSVSCTNTTQYVIVLNAETVPGATVPIGKFTFPLRSLMSYAMSSGSASTFYWGETPGTATRGGFINPIIAYGEPVNPSFRSPSPDLETISVAIIY